MIFINFMVFDLFYYFTYIKFFFFFRFVWTLAPIISQKKCMEMQVVSFREPMKYWYLFYLMILVFCFVGFISVKLN